MNFSSSLIENAVNEFSKLPGIGKRTALRLVLHLLNNSSEVTSQFSNTIQKMRNEIKFCSVCHNVSDDEQCKICSDKFRDRTLVCVVESIREVMAIENTNQYKGTYHVLGGVISPINGVSPEQLTISSFIERIQNDGVQEVIMALNPTMDGDTTIFYLSKKLAEYSDVKVTTLSRGVAFGGELEYVDEITLARSMATRLPFDNYMSTK